MEKVVKMNDMLFTVKEVSEILKCNVDLVYKLKNKGLLPFMKLGSLKCRRQALEDFLERYEGYDLSDLDNIKELRNEIV